MDRDVQTEDLGAIDKFNQAPDDIATDYQLDKNKFQKKNWKKNDALKLQKFLTNAGPMMVKVLEENQRRYEKDTGKERAGAKNAVEEKLTVSFPKQFLLLYSDLDRKPAEVLKISCIHMFESAPQNKFSVAYILKKANESLVYIVLVFSVHTKKFSHFI
jgi:hypothetical protein